MGASFPPHPPEYIHSTSRGTTPLDILTNYPDVLQMTDIVYGSPPNGPLFDLNYHSPFTPYGTVPETPNHFPSDTIVEAPSSGSIRSAHRWDSTSAWLRSDIDSDGMSIDTSARSSSPENDDDPYGSDEAILWLNPMLVGQSDPGSRPLNLILFLQAVDPSSLFFTFNGQTSLNFPPYLVFSNTSWMNISSVSSWLTVLSL